MYKRFPSFRRIFLNNGRLFLAEPITVNKAAASDGKDAHFHTFNRMSTDSKKPCPTLPIRRGLFLNSLQLSVDPSSDLSEAFTPTPLYSPISSPPSSPSPPESPSGLLQLAKNALENGYSKRATKASNLLIDEDMKKMCYFFSQLGNEERTDFLVHIATSLTPNHEIISQLIKEQPKDEVLVNTSDSEAQIIRWEDRLRQALIPPHYWVSSQISRLSGGVKFLVDLRLYLLETIFTLSSEETKQIAALKSFDRTLRDLLSVWFTVGLLNLERITWDSSCSMLEKISEYEAVHPVRNWADLKRRVGPYRRCFVFTHSCMPKEPLVVLHTFLTNEISSSMAPIIQASRAGSPDGGIGDTSIEDHSTINTAIFYSITSTQKGLQGIELGNYLIKKVVQELKSEFSGLTQFSSLSPIPGFVKWLNPIMARAQRGESKIFYEDEIKMLKTQLGVSSDSLVYDRLRKMFSNNSWKDNELLVNTLEAPLMRLCAFYLFKEKRRSYTLNSVANFHLKNGAVMWRINWMADRSVRGLGNSCGIMVNYRYIYIYVCMYVNTFQRHTDELIPH
ncbi:unnamed protein product, partial [Meganyctiphanes norvegica]